MSKKDIASYSLDALKKEMEELGEKPFRAAQIYQWIHSMLADSFDDMTNLSKELRKTLEREYKISTMDMVDRQVSKQDKTEKFLFRLEDGNVIESVLMSYDYGNSVCISSQVGCRMGCSFCASAIGGLKRNLTTSEMLRQLYKIQKITEKRISNVVVMGTGEPLDNYDNLLQFVHMLTDKNGLHISGRSVTISTCGLVPQMRRLAKEKLTITLALSLHGATQVKRQALMPIAKQYMLDEVLDACGYYFEETKRRVTFEYALVSGVNDTDEDAKYLTKIMKGTGSHLNLIPVNPVKERRFLKPEPENARNFKNKLEKNGINVTIRRERGSDIDGACGQLRRHYMENHEEK